MAKIILFNLVSVEGFFARPNGEIDWHNVDEEFNQFAIHQLGEAGGLIFGRKTYELMAGYWLTPEAIASDPVVAEKMNKISKIVFSRTLVKADWKNTRLVKNDAAGVVTQLKLQQGKDFFVFGSGNLSETLIDNGLIDEFRLIVNPVLLATGMPLFQRLTKQVNLKFQSVRTFSNGNVLLYYGVER
jgi:dihydrofolate reductase